MKRRAFGLVDSMIAMTVVLVAAGGILGTCLKNREAIRLHSEREVAREILANAQSLPSAYLEAGSERHFTFRGLASGTPDRYRLRVETTRERNSICYQATLSYLDAARQLRFLNFERCEWRQYEGL